MKKHKIVSLILLIALVVGAYFALDWYQKDPVNKNPEFKRYIGDKDNKTTATYELEAIIDDNKLKLELFKATKTNRNVDLRNQRQLNQEFVYTTLTKEIKQDDESLYYQYLFIFVQDEDLIDLSKLEDDFKVEDKEIKSGTLYLIEKVSEESINLNEIVKIIDNTN